MIKVWNIVRIFGISDKVMTNRVDRLIFRNEDKKSQEFIHFLKTSKNKKLKELLESCKKHEWKNWLFEVEIRTGGQVIFNALHVAIVMQNMDVIDHLLDKEDMDYINAQVSHDTTEVLDDKCEDDNWIYGATALHLAARFYHQSLPKLIEVSNELIDNQDNVMSFSPLHITAIAEYHLGSRILIKKGATVDALDKHQRTPLYFAAKSENYLDVVTLVEEGGARIYFKDNQYQPYRVAKSSDIMKFFFTKMTPSDLLEIDPQIQLYDDIVKTGNFNDRNKLPKTQEIWGKNILIAGFGRIGQCLIKRCLGFEMNVFVLNLAGQWQCLKMTPGRKWFCFTFWGPQTLEPVSGIHLTRDQKRSAQVRGGPVCKSRAYAFHAGLLCLLL